MGSGSICSGSSAARSRPSMTDSGGTVTACAPRQYRCTESPRPGTWPGLRGALGERLLLWLKDCLEDHGPRGRSGTDSDRIVLAGLVASGGEVIDVPAAADPHLRTCVS